MGIPDAEDQGPTDGLPDLPPEWGRIVVPDDLSALADEATLVRQELRAEARRRRWQRRLGGTGSRVVGLPLMILLVIAVTATTALLSGAWPRPPRGGDRPTVVPYPTATGLAGHSLPALDLVDSDQDPISLRGLLPAVIILVDGCVCAAQVADAVSAVPEGVTVVTVTGDTAPVPAPTPTSDDAHPINPQTVRALADPAGGLRAFLHLPARPDSTTVLLVHRSGTVQRVHPEVRAVDDYRAELVSLAR
ncbi:hypothetical protein ABT336_22575 [Micromonospora sp. NPDC000207]|uniref:hypothetical protein n=1 Tax=Micromonospora sp. NPDC000207 TaxID=3154246 RepID=UPI00331DBCBC